MPHLPEPQLFTRPVNRNGNDSIAIAAAHRDYMRGRNRLDLRLLVADNATNGHGVR